MKLYDKSNTLTLNLCKSVICTHPLNMENKRRNAYDAVSDEDLKKMTLMVLVRRRKMKKAINDFCLFFLPAVLKALFEKKGFKPYLRVSNRYLS